MKKIHTLRGGRGLVAAAATLSLLAMPLLSSPADAARAKAPAVKVMTRNVYLGADIMRPINALGQAKQDHPGDQIAQLNAFANANDATRDIVDTTNFAVRAELLAGEIATAKPDLVGMQEVALWRSGPMAYPGSDTFLKPHATTVDFDFLQMLLDELAAKGVEYKAISVAKRADVEAPAYEGQLGSPEQQASSRDVRLTMRDVVIRRVGSDVRVVKGSKGNKIYDDNLSFDVDGNPDHLVTFSRGYQWVDLKDAGYRFRFVNTHFEAFGSDLAYAQAQELVDGAAGYDGTTIMTCDCNSDPLLGTIKSGETARHWDPYYLLLRSGLNDTWLQKYSPQQGFSSGLSETVDDPDASQFDHRIDLVLARTANGDKLKALSGDVVGNDVADRDADTGLWPSDHAGVVMKLRLR